MSWFVLNNVIVQNAFPFWQNAWFYIALILILGSVALILLLMNANVRANARKDTIVENKQQEISKLQAILLRKKDEIEDLRLKLNEAAELEKLQFEKLTQKEIALNKENKKKEQTIQGLEVAIKELQNQQNKLIQEQTHELVLAKDKAEESDKLKSAFLANLSHEIRTPMNGIIGFSQLLSSPNVSEERRNEYVKMIVESSKSLLFLIDDIIDISKIDTEQLELKRSNIFINRVLTELFQSFKKYIEQKGRSQLRLALKKGVVDEYFSINTDSQRLKQALSHLLNNAVKFTDHGYVEFGYELLKEHPNGEQLKFFVKDSGIGLPQDKQDVIFERFSKLNEDKGKIYRGAGLGLTITKNLVKLLGGEIWVESELGKGSEFYFTLPVGSVTRNAPVEIKPGIRIVEKPDWQNKTILIAEDDLVNYKYLEASLRDTKAVIIWAKNGVEAVNLFEEHDDIDIVLMDIQMPVLNGYEATKQIKEINPNMPVIAQTAFAMEEDRILGKKAGCIDYLKKPIKLKDLIHTLNKYL